MLAATRSLALLKWLPNPCTINGCMFQALCNSLCFEKGKLRWRKADLEPSVTDVVGDVVRPNHLTLGML